MIKEFVERFDAKREWLKGEFSKAHPESYEDIVKLLVSALGSEDEDECPSPARVHKIDDGDYQGTLVFVIGAAGYQPSRYWFTSVSYGSCSGCDTLQRIRDYMHEVPTDEQAGEYMTLALHLLQNMKPMMGE